MCSILRRSEPATNKLINRTENASAFGQKAKSKLRWWPNRRVAAGYHEPLEAGIEIQELFRIVLHNTLKVAKYPFCDRQ